MSVRPGISLMPTMKRPSISHIVLLDRLASPVQPMSRMMICIMAHPAGHIIDGRGIRLHSEVGFASQWAHGPLARFAAAIAASHPDGAGRLAHHLADKTLQIYVYIISRV